MNTCESPESDSINQREVKPPKAVVLIYVVFALISISVFVINLFGVYGMEPTPLLSVEMFVVISAILLILFWVWKATSTGKRDISTIIYIFLAVSLVFDGPKWLQVGFFVGFPEFLTVFNFILLLAALFLVKRPLRGWYVR